MNTRCVLIGVGADRPGLVQAVSEFVLVRGGSIETSRMINLSGSFAIAILIAGSEKTQGAIESELHLLQSMTGVQAHVTKLTQYAPEPVTLYRLTGHALDQAGLVHEVANTLVGLDVNIESMETSIEPAPITGTPTFSMGLVIAAPPELAPARLREALHRTCDSLNVDWTLDEYNDECDNSVRLAHSQIYPSCLPDHGWGPSQGR